MISLIIACYLTVGIILLFFGPLKDAVSKAVTDNEPSPFVDVIVGRQPASIAKLLLFKIVLSVAVILFWIVFLPSEMKNKAYNNNINIPEDTRLRFQSMGGAGIITCIDCGYTKNIISFIHGIDDSTSGYQCKACGEFVEIENAFEDSIEGGCKCGGTVMRDEVLFCPKCRSHNLHYGMEYIT
jgi:hypothetical protein